MKVQPPKLASAENETAVVLEVPKNAVPVGTTAGLQLAAVLKSPVPGLVDQVESAACAAAVPASVAAKAVEASHAARLVEIRRNPDTCPPDVLLTARPLAARHGDAIGVEPLEQ
ncbi:MULTISPECIES: hypothetical protein [Bradyrhizobium]|uniref:hypothetical protein n=1 Tax=Bradyrhizobium TaxID=374 RepID=UPI0012F8B340|nr:MULTISPECIES: hypothetical protein [Bradyrhizobium]MCK1311409.1 hypothetical protein [Bradyrhizobium sp. 45]MCK1430069.1 hypothetical protein [Bradyrhizobium sp. 87]MCK1436645.1 hypothetical protein [Bradyrhizobium sp. 15]MCK1604040.1 hypothetical protein [Bradyrhizobium sp. 166]MCK1611459.1 hypothetical protein [Bradyrhizobium sp. 163]MCK1761574.1 hypothetical protein [Bradyrhizobium sp. 136]